MGFGFSAFSLKLSPRWGATPLELCTQWYNTRIGVELAPVGKARGEHPLINDLIAIHRTWGRLGTARQSLHQLFGRYIALGADWGYILKPYALNSSDCSVGHDPSPSGVLKSITNRPQVLKIVDTGGAGQSRIGPK
jgi:hypothetical protein